MQASLKRVLRRTIVPAVLATAAWQAVSWTQPWWAFPVAEALAPNVLWRVKTARPLVGLTFDDGPDPTYTPHVLDILDTHGAKATFFVIGERAARHPEILERMRRSGHEIGNHYFINGATLGHSDEDFVRYLERTEAVARINPSRKLFRPPGGVAWPRQLSLARARGYTTVLGSAYPHDPAHPPVGYINWLVAKNLRPGAIVILHDGIADPTRTIDALPAILFAGRAKGLQFVTVGALLDAAATP